MLSFTIAIISIWGRHTEKYYDKFDGGCRSNLDILTTKEKEGVNSDLGRMPLRKTSTNRLEECGISFVPLRRKE